LGTAYCR